MATVMWVPVKWHDPVVAGGGPPDPGWRADVPFGVAYSAEIPSILEGPDRGKPAVTYCRVTIKRDGDVAKVTTAIPEKDVPEEDRLLIEMCRTPLKRHFLNSIQADTPERRPMKARLVRHAELRGLIDE